MANPNLKENKFKRLLCLPFRSAVRVLFPVTYVKLQYKYITHHKLNLKNPVRYTEKLQYLRLYTYPNNPLVSQCASTDWEIRPDLSTRGDMNTRTGIPICHRPIRKAFRLCTSQFRF